ncbi:MAG: DUF4080 domain-containing protein [Ruminiclostridium sp.]|nr:DUF4080 domain-containing protein [Ruminiclostridium sp.]
MKTLIIALNSKYVHSSLAPWYLKAACNGVCGEVKVIEFTINENPESILAAVYAERADIAAFSCYIWNIGQILRIAENLKKIQPYIITVFGGPEVSYDPVELLQKHPFVDCVISGEGEKPFPRLLKCIYQKHKESSAASGKTPVSGDLTTSDGEYCKGMDSSGECRPLLPIVKETEFAARVSDKLKEIAGLTYRAGDAVESNPMDLPPDLSEIPSPYSEEMLASIKGKIAYFEASRGCPFSCSYCLSSADEGVRFFPMERVKEDLTRVIEAGVRQVKFVDRTFNCNKERAKELLRFIAGLQTATNLHFEAAADLFDDELISILAEMPKGLIQLEVGIQTVNIKTLKAVKRKTDTDKVFKNIKRILQAGNIHVHLDLIAGLPYEGLESFKESFNRVYGLKPHTLQLGFLKLLKGSSIRENSRQHAYVFRDYAPYEVLSSKYISYDELTLLKGMEEILDRYWNSGRFTIVLDYIIHNYFTSAFDFYLDFYRFNLKMNKNIQSVSVRDLISLLLDYVKSIEGIDLAGFKEYLKIDFLASDSSGYLPTDMDRISTDGFNDKCYEFLRDQSNLAAYLPAFTGLPAKQIMKKVHFELIYKASSVYLFDYTAKDPVTRRFRYCIIDNF